MEQAPLDVKVKKMSASIQEEPTTWVLGPLVKELCIQRVLFLFTPEICKHVLNESYCITPLSRSTRTSASEMRLSSDKGPF